MTLSENYTRSAEIWQREYEQLLASPKFHPNRQWAIAHAQDNAAKFRQLARKAKRREFWRRVFPWIRRVV